MSKKQKRILVKLEILELILSIIGFILSCMVFAVTRMNERYFFYAIAIMLGFNIIHSIKKLENEKEQTKVMKYSKKLVSTKKVSY